MRDSVGLLGMEIILAAAGVRDTMAVHEFEILGRQR